MDEDLKEYLKECTKAILILADTHQELANKLKNVQDQLDKLERVVGSMSVKW